MQAKQELGNRNIGKYKRKRRKREIKKEQIWRKSIGALGIGNDLELEGRSLLGEYKVSGIRI